MRKRSARPRLSLTDRLANLHLLLRSNSFGRWPLKLTFFSEDVFRVWQKWTEQRAEQLRPGIEVVMDETSRGLPTAAQAENSSAPANAVGINALDIGYSSLKPRLEKSQAAFDGKRRGSCSICQKPTSSSGAGTLICVSDTCSSVAHLHCLSTKFLKSEKADTETLVPTAGKCPKCGTQTQWSDLVKELSLRMRGEKEVKVLFKAKRGKKAASAAVAAVEEAESSEEDDPMDMVLEQEDEWEQLSESDDAETGANQDRSDPSPGHGSTIFKRGAKRKATNFSEPIIEDSDWDDAELLT